MAVAAPAVGGRPAAVRVLIGGVCALGAAALAGRVAVLAHGAPSALLWAAVVAGAVALADQFTLALPHGGDEEQFALTDAVWVTALVLAAPGVPTVGAAAGALAWQAAQRYEPRKIAFNVGQVALALTAAELIWSLAGSTPPGPAEPAAWALAAAACGVAFAINEGTVALVIALVRAAPVREVVTGSLRVSVLQWAGNVAIGLLAALVLDTAPLGLVLLAVPLGLVYLAYREWVAGLVEREQMEDLALTAERIARDGDATARLPMIAPEGRLAQLAAGLNRMLERLEQALARERRMLHQAARELDAPVRTLRRELLDADGASPCPLTVRRELDSMAGVIGEMEAVATAAVPGQVRPAAVALHPFLTRVGGRGEPFLHGRLTVERPPPGATARLDPHWTEAALLRLLHNAAVHGRDGAPIELRAVALRDGWRLEVTDEGGGVPAGLEESVFEPFFRLPPETSRPGLGLALVRSVASAHGGAAGIRNRPGTGATFWLRLPS